MRGGHHGPQAWVFEEEISDSQQVGLAGAAGATHEKACAAPAVARDAPEEAVERIGSGIGGSDVLLDDIPGGGGREKAEVVALAIQQVAQFL